VDFVTNQFTIFREKKPASTFMSDYVVHRNKSVLPRNTTRYARTDK